MVNFKIPVGRFQLEIKIFFILSQENIRGKISRSLNLNGVQVMRECALMPSFSFIFFIHFMGFYFWRTLYFYRITIFLQNYTTCTGLFYFIGFFTFIELLCFHKFYFYKNFLLQDYSTFIHFSGIVGLFYFYRIVILLQNYNNVYRAILFFMGLCSKNIYTFRLLKGPKLITTEQYETYKHYKQSPTNILNEQIHYKSHNSMTQSNTAATVLSLLSQQL